MSTDRPTVHPFFDDDTGTFTYVVYVDDIAAIVDPVLDYDAAAARTSTRHADEVTAFIRDRALRLEWILETHAHADHLSAGALLRDRLGAKLAIGRGIQKVQARFRALFGLGDTFAVDGRQFDRLLDDGDSLPLGSLAIRTLSTPGHTDDSLTYVVGDAAFIGDTLFAPHAGTARCDFPGGEAKQLYASIQRILSLPEHTRLFLCHDYPPPGHDAMAETTISAQLTSNIHVRRGIPEADFVAMRNARDATLPPPRLILPAVQVNIRGGRLPEPDDNGIAYLRLPVNQIGTPH